MRDLAHHHRTDRAAIGTEADHRDIFSAPGRGRPAMENSGEQGKRPMLVVEESVLLR